MDQCYDIIKQIAKKHPEKIKPLKKQFITGFQKKLIEEEKADKTLAKDTSEKVWQIIDDSTQYNFNSSHSFAVALDGLYCAYLKANYPYEFYEVLMQTYSDKGQKDKVTALKKEMQEAFGIQEGKYKWGADNRKFVADSKNQCIYPSLLSIKGLSQGCANDLFKMAQENIHRSFYQLWKDMKSIRSLNSGKIDILIKIGYFEEFATVTKLEKFMEAIEVLYDRTQFKKVDIPDGYKDIIQKYSETTDQLKVYRNFDFESALEELWNTIENSKLPLNKRLKYELDYLGYPQTIRPKL
jgi:DNA polymerase III alpha subunit